MFYGFGHRLANGFVRNGHFVLSINDRDSRKRMLGVKSAAAWHANRRLLTVARELRPDLLCLHHCDLIAASTIRQIKKIVPGCRVAVVYYDNLVYSPSANRFRSFLEEADFAFATTAGPALARFSDACPVAFIPNPVDLSIDNLAVFSTHKKVADVFYACGPNGVARRWDLVDELQKLRPDFVYDLHGRDKNDRIFGDAYYRAMNRAKVGLNLNRCEGDLYASDRMAQYLGNGLLLATSRDSGYQAYFEDDEMIFFDDAAELGDKIQWAVSDDHRWRTMAQKARLKASVIMDGQLVTQFIMQMALGLGEPDGWQFSDQIYPRPAKSSVPMPSPMRAAALPA